MTTTTDLAAAVARLDAAIAAGDVIRHEWTRTEDDGRERACLLASLVPACGADRTASVCPASVLPSWLAECDPKPMQVGSAAAWPAMIRDFADLLRDSASAPPALWERLNLHWLRVALAEAMAHTDDLAVLGICAEVAAMLDAELAGESIDPAAWTDARTAARAATAWGVATSATSAASERAAEAAWAATAWARSAAAAAAAAAEAEASATAATAASAAQEAADRITFEFFAAWRAELDAQTTGDRS